MMAHSWLAIDADCCLEDQLGLLTKEPTYMACPYGMYFLQHDSWMLRWSVPRVGVLRDPTRKWEAYYY